LKGSKLSEIKDGVYGYVSGTVGRVADGRFTVEVKREGRQYPDYVTVWSSDIFVQQGDRISVKGWLSWKKTERNDKVYVDVSVNHPKVEKKESSRPSSSPSYGSETPF
jgi:hypothetical protein